MKRLVLLMLLASCVFAQRPSRFPWGVASDSLIAFSDSSRILFIGDSLWFKQCATCTPVNLMRTAAAAPSDSSRAAWKADTLTGDVDVLIVHDSLEVGAPTNKFVVSSEGKVKQVGAQAAAGNLGVMTVTAVIAHGDPATPGGYVDPIVDETVEKGVVYWTIATDGRGSTIVDLYVGGVVVASVDFSTTTVYSGSLMSGGTTYVNFAGDGANEYGIRVVSVAYE